MTKKVRVEFDFTEPALEKLNELVERLEADSRAEVVRRSLALMDYLTSEQDGTGIEVHLHYPSGEQLRLLPPAV